MIQQIKTKWQSDMYFIADSLGGSVDLDAAEDIGGQGKGKRPKALMLVSLAGCTGMDVALMIKKMRLEVEDFTIDVKENLLSISSETKTEKVEKEENFTRKEFNYESFKRSFKLPEIANLENISATYLDGILKISIPKKEVKKETVKSITVS